MSGVRSEPDLSPRELQEAKPADVEVEIFEDEASPQDLQKARSSPVMEIKRRANRAKSVDADSGVYPTLTTRFEQGRVSYSDDEEGGFLRNGSSCVMVGRLSWVLTFRKSKFRSQHLFAKLG